MKSLSIHFLAVTNSLLHRMVFTHLHSYLNARPCFNYTHLLLMVYSLYTRAYIKTIESVTRRTTKIDPL